MEAQKIVMSVYVCIYIRYYVYFVCMSLEQIETLLHIFAYIYVYEQDIPMKYEQDCKKLSV